MNPPSLSSLSAGIIVRQLLTQSPEVQRITHRIFPIVIDDAQLPYVVYRRAALETQPTKSLQSADTVTIEVACYAATYGESVDLAEAVRHALDCTCAPASSTMPKNCGTAKPSGNSSPSAPRSEP